MRVYFINKSVHQKLVDVADDVYAFLSKHQCSAFKKNIYLADDGYYEIRDDHVYRNQIDFNKTQQAPTMNSPELVVSMASWAKTEVSFLPSNSIKVEFIVERFKISETTSFIIERNDEDSIDYFFEIKGKSIEEHEIISFLSEITNVCVN
jgi:hypothetical protein